jgi:hypothetical protein
MVSSGLARIEVIAHLCVLIGTHRIFIYSAHVGRTGRYLSVTSIKYPVLLEDFPYFLHNSCPAVTAVNLSSCQFIVDRLSLSNP